MSSRAQLVRIGETEFFAEFADGGGPQPVGAAQAWSFDGVRETVEAVAEQLAAAWEKAQPDEASVEFGLSFTARTGKLTGLLVDGGAQAALKITLKWKAGGTQEAEVGADISEANGGT